MGVAVAEDQEFTLPPLEERPLVTFALFAYNQEKYIREAVEGAFAQTYEPLEIILSDDCSTDRTFEIMEEMAAGYMGPHKIALRRPNQNLGLARGVSEVSKLGNGELIIAAAGDDISTPNRTEVLVATWIKYGKISGSIYSHFIPISEDGSLVTPPSRWPEWRISLSDRQLFMLNDYSGLSGCAHAWTKDIFEIFGPINDHINHEDLIIPLRALLIGSIIFTPKDLVYYRLTHGSITRRSFSSAKERFTKMGKYWADRAAIFEQFRSDIKTSPPLKFANASDLEWLVEDLNGADQRARTMARFYNGSGIQRISIAFKPNVAFSMSQKIKLLILALAPWMYGLKIPK